MNEKQLEAIRLIEEQQKELPAWSPARMAGEQLKGIASMDPNKLTSRPIKTTVKGADHAEED